MVILIDQFGFSSLTSLSFVKDIACRIPLHTCTHVHAGSTSRICLSPNFKHKNFCRSTDQCRVIFHCLIFKYLLSLTQVTRFPLLLVNIPLGCHGDEQTLPFSFPCD